MQEIKEEKSPVIFKDTGDMVADHSLEYFDSIRRILEGEIVKLEAQRGSTPELVYNVKLFTDRNEEVWLSGFTCGKPELGTGKLCVLISMLGWTPRYIPTEEVIRIARYNNSFKIEFKSELEKKKIFIFDSRKVLKRKINLN